MKTPKKCIKISVIYESIILIGVFYTFSGVQSTLQVIMFMSRNCLNGGTGKINNSNLTTAYFVTLGMKGSLVY